MQRYQVFIDEHSIFIGEDRKSIQQFEDIFELYEPTPDDIDLIVEWLSKEKETTQHVFLNTSDPNSLWEKFQSRFKLIEAAGGLVKNSDKEILFIHRLGKWDLPKGKLEKGENPQEAAVREVEEECGISNLKLEAEVEPTYHMYFHKEKWVLKKTYWFNMYYAGKEKLIPQLEEAIEKAEWVKQSNLEKQLENTYSSLKKMIENI